jgi:hypothetical protein
MRGIPQCNFPAFHAAAAKLRAEGHEVFSPAERDIAIYGGNQPPRGQRQGLAEDLDWICRHADAVALLPGWSPSKGGVNAERAIALALGLEVIQL